MHLHIPSVDFPPAVVSKMLVKTTTIYTS